MITQKQAARLKNLHTEAVYANRNHRAHQIVFAGYGSPDIRDAGRRLSHIAHQADRDFHAAVDDITEKED